MRETTPLRKLILQLLSEHHFLSAYQILDLLKQQGVVVNKTSVYRALEILVQEKKVFRQLFNTQSVVYERCDNHHDHLICLHCGAVKNIPCHQTTPIVTDFTVEFHALNFYGYCDTCSQVQKATLLHK
jgi:Fe2+ or Zn2+ uptake regulation protein